MKAILPLLCLLPVTLFSQVYKFNRQILITLENEKIKEINTTLKTFFIEVTQKKIIIKKMPSNSNDRMYTDTLIVKGTSKNKIRKIYNINDGSKVIIYADKYLDVVTKEKNGRHTEISFYNHE